MAQLYLGFPPAAGAPPKVLRRFAKVSLAAKASTTVTFDALDPTADLGVWDEATHKWAAVRGEFALQVGASSRDIRLHGKLQM